MSSSADTIEIFGASLTINSGDGNDYVTNEGLSVTVDDDKRTITDNTLK